MRSETETLPTDSQERFAEQTRHAFPVAVVRSRCVRTLVCIAIVAGCLGQSCSSVPPLADSDQLDEQVAGYQPDDPAAEPDGGIPEGNDEPTTPYIPPVIVDPPYVEPPVVDPPIIDPPIVDPPTEPEPDLVFEIAASKVKGPAPLDVDFSPLMANNEPLPEGWYYWDFGDGSTAEGPYVNHVFQSAGTYTVALCIAIGSATGCAESDAGRAAVADAKAGRAKKAIEATTTQQNSLPIANDLSESAVVGVAKTIALQGSSSAAVALTFAIKSLPTASELVDPSTGHTITQADVQQALGYALVNQGTQVQFIPAAVGNDSFTYLVHDGTSVSTEVTVAVGVTAAPSGTLVVSPSMSFTTSGPVGGPFTPASMTYSVSNSGTADLSWSASSSQTWVTLSPNGGVLRSGDPPVEVVASLAAGANSLPAGTYNSTLSFVNLTNNDGSTTQGVSITVEPRPARLGLSPTEAFQASGIEGTEISGSRTYTLTNTGDLPVTWSGWVNVGWITLSRTAGTLGAGEAHSVTVQLNPNVASLEAGTHSGAFTFTSTDIGVGPVSGDINLVVAPQGLTARIRPSLASGQAPLTVIFDGGESIADNPIVDFEWEYGDAASEYVASRGSRTGQPINGPKDFGTRTAHRFVSPGDYVVRLTITTSNGQRAVAETLISVQGFAGQTFYVGSQGNDSNAGTSQDTAWATLDKVASVIRSGLVRAGDRVLFQRGHVFSGQINVDGCLGTPESPITLGAYGTGDRPELRESAPEQSAIIYFRNTPIGATIVLDDLYIHRTSWTTGSAIMSFFWQLPTHHNVVIRGCVIEGGYDAITWLYGNSLTMEDCIVRGAQRQGLKTDIPKTVLRHCEFVSNGTSTSLDHNIYATSTSNSLVENCSVHHGSGGGITIHGVVEDVSIRWNDVYNNDVGLSITAGYSTYEEFRKVRVDSNYVRDNANMGVYANCLVDSEIVNNLIVNNGSANGNLNLASGNSGDASTRGTLIAHNVLAGTGTQISLALSRTDADCAVQNNIVWYQGTSTTRYCIALGANFVGSLSCDRNLFFGSSLPAPFAVAGYNKTFTQWQQAGHDVTGHVSDPCFTNASVRDYTVSEASWALNRAIPLDRVVRDREGRFRGVAPDVGAYER